jgi:hypothetical protein
MPFYYSMNTSLSVDTLAMLARAPDGRVPMQAIEQRFCSERFLRDRLQTMGANGYLRHLGGDSWRISRRGLRVARAMSWVKQILGLGPGG